MNKYKNKKTEHDGIIFDSKLEARYYLHLKDLKKSKKIEDFQVKPTPYILQEKFVKNGKTIRAITYEADFLIEELDGTQVIVDTKGFITKDFALKEKMFHYKFRDLELRLMTYVQKYGGWRDLREVEKIRRENKKNKSKG